MSPPTFGVTFLSNGPGEKCCGAAVNPRSDRRPSLTGVARRPEGERTEAGGSWAMSNADSVAGGCGCIMVASAAGVHSRTRMRAGRRVGETVTEQGVCVREAIAGRVLAELGLPSLTRMSISLPLNRRQMAKIL
jgi:hypothetical protein